MPSASSWRSLRRLQPVEVVSTAVAFVLLQRLNLLGKLPIAILVGLLLLAAAVARLTAPDDPSTTSSRSMWLRMGLHTACVYAVIYATGWGPALAGGSLVLVANDLRTYGAAAWRPSVVLAMPCLAIGQLALFSHVVPSYVPTPAVHGLAMLSALWLVFVIRLLGNKTEQVELEEQQRRGAEAALRSSERRFRSLVQASADVITVLDAEGRITYVSQSVLSVTGYSAEEYLGLADAHELVHPDDRLSAKKVIVDAQRHPRDVAVGELRTRHIDGSWRWQEVTVRNLLDDPDIRGIVATHHDITERLEYQSRLLHEASHDPLTGLMNRRAFLARLDQSLARTRRHRRGMAVLFIDLDHFKQVNDTRGHLVGDALLKAVAQRLAALLRPEDCVSRLSGDEFAVITEDVDGHDAALSAATRIADDLARPIDIGDAWITITASVGVCFTVDAEESADDVLGRADAAMYDSKSAGRGGASLYSASLSPGAI